MQGVTWAHRSPAGWLRRPPPQVPPTPWPASPWDPVTLASFLFLASGPSRGVPSSANTVPSAQPTPASPSAHRLHATPPSCPEPSPLPSRGDTPRGARLLSLQKPLPHDSLAQQGTSPERESVTSLSVTPPPLAPPSQMSRGVRVYGFHPPGPPGPRVPRRPWWGPHARSRVSVPPTIADDQTDFTVTQLAPVVLTCHSVGVPAPLVSWRKAGTRLGVRGNGYRVLPSGRNGDHGEPLPRGPRALGAPPPPGPCGGARRRFRPVQPGSSPSPCLSVPVRP